MTQEDKELLLKDLCARLPYGVICTDNRHGESKITDIDTESWVVYLFDVDEYVSIEACRPYLRPISSITKEENEKWKSLMRKEYKEQYPYAAVDTSYTEYFPTIESFDFLNSHHFDYRGLLEKGIALKATPDMYKI